MMLPNEILNKRFSKAGKDGYKTSEVDAFKDQIYKSYNKLYNENNILNGRVSELNSLMQKYNSDKEAIASTLIYAQSTSDRTLSEARQKADEIVAQANERAEKEYAEKIRQAEEKLKNLEADYEKTKVELERYSATYTENINAQAKEIIEKANAQAAKIIAEAKAETDRVQKENDVNVKNAKKELKKMSDLIAKFGIEIHEVTSKIDNLADGISSKVYAEIGKFDFSDIEAETVDVNSIETFSMPDFSEILSEALEENKDISSGKYVPDNSISGLPKYKVDDLNEYITKIFDTIGSDSADFTSYKEGLTEALSKGISSNGDVSFAIHENTGEETLEE